MVYESMPIQILGGQRQWRQLDWRSLHFIPRSSKGGGGDDDDDDGDLFPFYPDPLLLLPAYPSVRLLQRARSRTTSHCTAGYSSVGEGGVYFCKFSFAIPRNLS